MKLTLITLLASLSLSTFASTFPTQTLTCEEVNELLESRGTLYVKYGLLGISRGTMWADSNEAAERCYDGVVQQKRVKALDGSCLAGYMCVQN